MSRTHERGVSIIEALVSLTVFLFVFLAVLASYAPSRRVYSRGERKVDIQQNARMALADMTRQIRMAGYFPENFADPPVLPALTDPIRVATDRALAIYGDLDGSGASNAFLFCLDGNLLRRGRGAVGSGGTYTCSSGEVLAEQIVELRFTYYDADNNPVPSPPTAPYQLDGQNTGAAPNMDDTTLRSSVRRAVVTLTAREDVPSQNPQLYTLTSDVWMRNIH